MSKAAMAETRMRESGADLRRAARAGFAGLTVGRAPGFVQANLFVLPEVFAGEFEAFCRANPKACPLLAFGRPGETGLPTLGRDLDLRTDLPGYLVHRSGAATATRDLTAFWRDDLVAFAIGCWFGAEAALAAAGIRMRHVELGIQGPLFRTARHAREAGRFKGPLVVSMRPFADTDVVRVRAVTAGMRLCHGAPLMPDEAAALGIVDLDRPDWGEPLRAGPGETELFWPCGLTALAALQAAGLPVFITHAPGAMLVTDLQQDHSP